MSGTAALGWHRQVSEVETIATSQRTTMLGPNFTEIQVSRCSDPAVAKRIVISADDARQGETGARTLYVLCFGVAGAIIASTILVCFAETGALR